ncbi:MAG: MAPEG family protein [Halioglobus sp.]|nr:MAPEG family protein [Halioglobus sp.]
MQSYEMTVYAIGVLALLLLSQLLVADVVGILSRHTPGSTIGGGHSDVLFRVSRTVANTNESIAIFVLAVLFCILSGASPTYTAYGAWGFVLSRALYAVFYYSNLQILRSTVFGISLLFLLGLLLTGFLL